MKREESGIPRLKGKDLRETLRLLGEAHATDRAAQMAMTRIIGQGRTTECIADTDELAEVDRYFRWLGLYRGADEEVAALGERARSLVDAYCAGVNETMARRRRPMPFRVWGYRWEPWRPQDMVLLLRTMAWVGLVTTQVNVERAIVELVHHGVGKERLLSLFSPYLQGCDFDLVRSVRLASRLTPAVLDACRDVGGMSASNNWAVMGAKTTGGNAILASDPHLEVNRLPPVWYEAILEPGAGYLVGATIPGLPAVVIGRNEKLAWGVTYTEADTTDFFVEECREGRFRAEEGWEDFEVVVETIRRRTKGPEELRVWRNRHGLLQGDPREEGRYLCLAWTGWHGRFADVIDAVVAINLAGSVEEGMRAVRGFHYPSLNWVFADRAGDVGYRMGGLFPVRREGWSGLYPVAGWQRANDWQGWVDPDLLPAARNPKEGFFSTANQDLTEHGSARVQNSVMADYRAARIRELLAKNDKQDVRYQMAVQTDIVSTKARLLVPLFLRCLPPGGKLARLLGEWKLDYSSGSVAATAFERLYRRALASVFAGGEGCVSEDMLSWLIDQTSAFLTLEPCLDRVLLSGDPYWFGAARRDDVLRKAFEKMDGEDFRPWGSHHRITMVNIFYGGKLPRFLGVDKGPFPIQGCIDTPRQGTIYRDAGRDTTFCPSYRFIADMGTDEAWTNIHGGPSEKSLSRFYDSELDAWLKGEYKRLAGRTAKGNQS